MCGRYTLYAKPRKLAGLFNLLAPPAVLPRYNIAPTQSVLAIRIASDARGLSAGREAVLLRWGLLTSVSQHTASPLINARSETAHEKPSFRNALRLRRCLIPADGYYEWQAVDRRKQPYLIRRIDQQTLAFAALWEPALHDSTPSRDAGNHNPAEPTPATPAPTGSCVILTTRASAALSRFHDRMPVILEPDRWDQWLDPATPAEEVQALLVPARDELLTAYPVSSSVNRVAYDGVDCLAPVPAVKPTPTLFDHET